MSNIQENRALKKPKINRRPFKGDPWLWTLVVLLMLISVLVVYSSSASMAYRVDRGDTSVYLIRQVRFVTVGFILMWITHWFNINIILRLGKLWLLLSWILLMWAYLMPHELNDASRSLNLGVFTIQPADPLKISLIIVLAVQLARRSKIIARIPLLPPLAFWRWRDDPQRVNRIIRKISLPLLLPIAISCAMIMYSNLSTALILFISTMVLMWLGRMRASEIWRCIAMVAMIVIVAVLVMRVFQVGRAETWVNRSMRFVSSVVQIDLPEGVDNKDDDFQLRQAEIAIASGGFLGKGPGNSTQRSQLPHPYSDFAYAFITEEYGLAGAVIIPLLYLLILIRARKIANNTPHVSHRLLVLGLSVVMMISAFLHMLVSVGWAPVTGQVLPLISLGGSAMAFNGISLGLILAVSRMTNRNRARLYHQKMQHEMDALLVETPNDDEVDIEDLQIDQEPSLDELLDNEQYS
ncbi:MAG: FtsW/RodA/SpoVE family cell cycle protein [Rikenellaceae bacterium]